MLFSKYANPFSLLDMVIQTDGFFDFVIEFFKIHDEEMTWQVWLHKDIDKSFADFKESLSVRNTTKEQVGQTIKESKSILNGFIPNC